jgi:hypothetical protein
MKINSFVKVLSNGTSSFRQWGIAILVELLEAAETFAEVPAHLFYPKAGDELRRCHRNDLLLHLFFLRDIFFESLLL